MSDSPLRKSLFLILHFVFSVIFSTSYSTMLSANPAIDNKFNRQTYEVGQMVLALQIAIKSPQQQASLLIIRHYDVITP